MSRGFSEPNYTQVPNDMFVSFKDMPNAAMRCILQIARMTFGFHRRRAKCSLTYLQRTTGLSRQGVINGTTWLLDCGMVAREQEGDSYAYEILVNLVDQPSQDSGPQPVNEVDRDLVHQVDTRKKEQERKGKKASSSFNNNRRANRTVVVAGAKNELLSRLVSLQIEDPTRTKLAEQLATVDSAALAHAFDRLAGEKMLRDEGHPSVAGIKNWAGYAVSVLRELPGVTR